MPPRRCVTDAKHALETVQPPPTGSRRSPGSPTAENHYIICPSTAKVSVLSGSGAGAGGPVGEAKAQPAAFKAPWLFPHGRGSDTRPPVAQACALCCDARTTLGPRPREPRLWPEAQREPPSGERGCAHDSRRCDHGVTDKATIGTTGHTARAAGGVRVRPHCPQGGRPARASTGQGPHPAHAGSPARRDPMTMIGGPTTQSPSDGDEPPDRMAQTFLHGPRASGTAHCPHACVSASCPTS